MYTKICILYINLCIYSTYCKGPYIRPLVVKSYTLKDEVANVRNTNICLTRPAWKVLYITIRTEYKKYNTFFKAQVSLHSQNIHNWRMSYPRWSVGMSKWGTGKFATLLFCPLRRRPRWRCPCERHKVIRESGGVVPLILNSALRGGVLGNFKVIYSFCAQSEALGSTHPLTERTTKEFPRVVKCVRRRELTTLPS
jgi:hypothetical protein